MKKFLLAVAALAVAVMSADVAEAGRRCGGRCHRERCGLLARCRQHCGPQETHCVTCTVPEKGYVQAPQVQAPVEKHVQAPQVQAPSKPIQGPPPSSAGVPSHPSASPPSTPRQDLNAPPVAPAR